ncbi:MAG TPA: hypothetical protein VFG69_08320 [Nannocystaceae bacterium]|nr:hypothetical protein [Nannocystaceae bacterium]
MRLQAISQLSVAAAAFVAVISYGADARASHLDACGGLFLEADAAAKCEVLTKESCETQCEPVAVERVCAARLFRSCENECTFTAEVSCQASCEESCVPGCESNGGDCQSLCMADCQASASASCDEGSECHASADACCNAKCETDCGDQDSSDCAPVCESACFGSCEGRASVDCQIDCQERSFVTCKEEVVQECHEQCETTGAAIFCDGHFLASSDGDLQACANDLLDEFGVEIDVDVDLDIDDDCLDHDDEEKIEDALSCSVTDPEDGGIAFGLMILLGIGGWRMRRIRRDAAA